MGLYKDFWLFWYKKNTGARYFFKVDQSVVYSPAPTQAGSAGFLPSSIHVVKFEQMYGSFVNLLSNFIGSLPKKFTLSIYVRVSRCLLETFNKTSRVAKLRL